MKKMQQIIMSLALIVGVGAVFIPAGTVGAIDVFQPCTGANKDTAVCAASKTDTSANKFITNVTNLLFFAIGTIAVIMIIIGGIRYATSDGDSAKLKSAKDTIMYSVVGIVVAILAYAIVAFVVNRFS